MRFLASIDLCKEVTNLRGVLTEKQQGVAAGRLKRLVAAVDKPSSHLGWRCQLEMNLHVLFIVGNGHRHGSAEHFHLRFDCLGVGQTRYRFGCEDIAEGIVQDFVLIRSTRNKYGLLGHDLRHGLAHEAQRSFDFLKGDFLVIEQILNRMADITLKRRGVNRRMQQSSDIVAAHGEALNEL